MKCDCEKCPIIDCLVQLRTAKIERNEFCPLIKLMEDR